MAIRVGVVLSGCGVFDGSEIHEAVSILVALDRRGASVQCLAPSVLQTQVMDHLKHAPDASKRNVLVESARIARGKIRDLASIKVDEFDALIFPGGFGCVTNLSDFAARGAECDVNPEVARAISQFHAAKKPIGLACIAPVLAAHVLGRLNFQPKLTIGQDPSTAKAIHAMGGEHHAVGPIETCIDEENRLVSTPCYMNDVSPWIVYQGAEKMVDEVLRLAGNKGLKNPS